MKTIGIVIPVHSTYVYMIDAIHSLYRYRPNDYELRPLVISYSTFRGISPEEMGLDKIKDMRVDFEPSEHVDRGLTPKWNTGIRMLAQKNCDYIVVTNDDILFTPKWHVPLVDALESNDLALVGPITNAPGHKPVQSIARVLPNYVLSDAPDVLEAQAAEIREAPSSKYVFSSINGFFMMAKTESWLSGAYSSLNVFNPLYSVAGNEDELQIRWAAQGRRIGFCPNSFIFHYRSVSRPKGLRGINGKGAYRKSRFQYVPPGTGAVFYNDQGLLT